MIKIDIPLRAEEIRLLLYRKGAMSIRHIADMMHYTDKIIYLCLGWLAREEKVSFFEKDETVYVKLNEHIPELFY